MANTSNRAYPKPVPENFISNDVTVLQVAFDMIDADVAAILVALAGKAASVHSHAMSDISGLNTALSGKAAVGHTHALGDLSNVNLSGIADGMVLVYSATLGFVPVTPGTLLGSHTHAISDILLLSDALAAKADAAATSAALGGKADLASPSFSGNPTAPTQTEGNSSTRIATTAFVQTAVAAGLASLRAGVSSAFDTLQELAAEIVGYGKIEVGDYCWSARSTKSKWLVANGNTIGSASSGANHAAGGYEALFTELWNSHSNTVLPILSSLGIPTTRGASAVADFAANKRLPLPDVKGRGMIGDGTGSGLTARTMGQSGGAETHALTQAQTPLKDHSHGIDITTTFETNNSMAGSGGREAVMDAAEPTNNGSYIHSITGTTETEGSTSATAHNNMQPYLVERCFIYAGV